MPDVDVLFVGTLDEVEDWLSTMHTADMVLTRVRVVAADPAPTDEIGVDDLPTPAMRSMDLRVIRLKAEAIEWRERAETAEAEVRRLQAADLALTDQAWDVTIAEMERLRAENESWRGVAEAMTGADPDPGLTVDEFRARYLAETGDTP